MSLLPWQDSYAVGVPAIDADHRLLFSLVNQLYDAREEGQAREVVASVLQVLVEYTIGHFNREERLMRLVHYPELEKHCQQHRELAVQVRRFQADYDGGRHAAVDELVTFLKGWLTGHILGVDTRYKPYVEQVELTALDLAGPFGDLSVEGPENPPIQKPAK